MVPIFLICAGILITGYGLLQSFGGMMSSDPTLGEELGRTGLRQIAVGVILFAIGILTC